MLEPPLRCMDCGEKRACLDRDKNKAYYVCSRSPTGLVYEYKCCNDVKTCPLGKPNLVLVK